MYFWLIQIFKKTSKLIQFKPIYSTFGAVSSLTVFGVHEKNIKWSFVHLNSYQTLKTRKMHINFTLDVYFFTI